MISGSISIDGQTFDPVDPRRASLMFQQNITDENEILVQMVSAGPDLKTPGDTMMILITKKALLAGIEFLKRDL